MSYPTQIFTPVLNTPITIKQPEVRNEPLTLVLQNQSAFVCLVRIGTTVSYIPAFTTDAYDIGRHDQKIEVTPLSSPTSSPLVNTLFGTFFTKGEELPFSAFPASLFGSPESVQVDNPFVAINANLTSGVETNPFFNEPATKYQSYQLRFSFSNGAASATNYATVTIRFYDSVTKNNIIWEDKLDINPGAVNTYITDRMHGTFMTILATFPGGTLACELLFSNRIVDRLRVMEQTTGNDRILLVSDTVTVVNGATSAMRFVPLFHGPAKLYIRASATQTYLAIFYFGSLAPIGFRFSGSNGADTYQDIILPTRPLRYTITNNGAASADFSTSIWVRDN